MYLEIITPDENVFEGEVNSAMFPGSDGSFQILNDHAPMVSALGKGDVKIERIHEKRTEDIHFNIDGGVVEVLNNKILVLAESIGE